MSITNKLNQLGLSNSETTIYLEGIQNSRSLSATELSSNTGVKRPTTYHALNSLAARGLVSKHRADGKLEYLFTPPSQLRAIARDQVKQARSNLELAESLIPALEDIAVDSEDIRVSEFKGEKAVKAAIEGALYCRKHEWLILAPRKNFLRDMPKDYQQYFITTRKRQDITARSLWESSFKPHSLAEEDVRLRNPRYLPDSMKGKFKTMLVIYDEKVLLVSSKQNASAILIDSKEVNGFFTALFEGLWAVSTS